MKDELLTLVSSKDGYNTKLNIMREYLQAFILRILFKNNFFKHAAFLGGTCLRFIYDVKRFSEDLDFSLQLKELFDFDKTIRFLTTELENSGYSISIKIKKNSIYSALIKFPGILYEAKMSDRKEENLSIKIDLDTNPPAGARIKQHIINKHFLFGVTCYDLSTLFAGKINAVLTRNYAKGRDYYDLFWYMTTHRGLEPNIEFLKNALAQFNWQGNLNNNEDWKRAVIETTQHADWRKIQKEIELLIEDPYEMNVFTKDNFHISF